MIKVLHFGLSDNYGGIENVVHSWFLNKPKDFQFDFVKDVDNKLSYEDEYINNGCKIFKINQRFTNPIIRIKDINKIISEGHYDIVHMHVMDIDDPIPIIIARKYNCKVLLHCHGKSEFKNSTFKEKILLLETKILLIGTTYDKVSCSYEAGKLMFNNSSFIVIKNGIDYQKFSFSKKDRDTIRSKYNIAKDDVVIGHIGHVCIEKNYPFIFSTLSLLIQKNNKFKLMLVGNICEDDDIDKQIKNKGLENNVIKIGYISDTSKVYSAMDIFYLPSIREGFPLVLLEAQANGLVCVTSNNVTKETAISNDIMYIDLDEEKAVNVLETIDTKRKEQLQVSYDFDINNTANELFEKYMQLVG